MCQTDVVVDCIRSLCVVLMNKCFDNRDGLIHMFIFFDVHSSQHHLSLITRVTKKMTNVRREDLKKTSYIKKKPTCSGQQ